MELFIAEKPSLAQAIVHGLGGGERKDGFFQCGEKIVTYCFGHILENFSPEDYDEKYKAWSLSTRPISPSPWKLKVKKDCRKQFGIIKKLLKILKTVQESERKQLAPELLRLCKSGSMSRW